MCVGIMVVSCTYNSTKTYVYGVLLEVQVPVLKKDFGTVWICVWDHVCKCWVKNRDSFGVNAETSAGEKDEGAKAMASRGIHGHLGTVRGWRDS